MTENIETKHEIIQVCSECKSQYMKKFDSDEMVCPMGCLNGFPMDAMICPVCNKPVRLGYTHICKGKECVQDDWQGLEKRMIVTKEEPPPTIEEYEAAVAEHQKTHPEGKGVSGRLPAEMVQRESIVIGNRFRKEYKNIEELAASIKEFGLLQYPVIDEDNNLIAGGRRMRALELLNWTFVPIVRKKNISELRLREMELEENIQREDLTWPEQIALKEEVFKLKVQLHGEKGTGRAAAARPNAVSQSDVAKLFGDSPATFTLDLQLARAVREIPALANCSSKDEARKKLKQLQEKLIVNELERRHNERVKEEETKTSETATESKEETTENGETSKGKILDTGGRDRFIGIEEPKSSLYARARDAFIVGDAIKGLQSIPTGTPFGYVNVDTPYGIDLNATKKSDPGSSGKVIEDNYIEWSKSEFLEKTVQPDGMVIWSGLAFETAKEVFRIVDNCAMTWWFAEQWQQMLFEMLTDVGWKVDPVPCIWATGKQGQTNQPEIYLARTYEPFFHCRKGQPIINKRGRSNVFDFQKLTADKKIHPTEKPLALMEELYATFAPMGCLVLSPFLGSGNDIIAAYRTGRNALGFDLNGEVKKRFLLRVAELEGFKR